ncbi:hypothetical protein H9P43_004670 [Blastocladiella emersonii ATCC 22665]|nr:hypothetical protein H9P43_004670 [Blastocladiella emersonii ATCC 22665]
MEDPQTARTDLSPELWITVLTHLAAIGSARDVAAVMRASRAMRSLARDERVAHALFLARNGDLARDMLGRAPRLADLPVSWWAAVEDQVRFHRAWAAARFDVARLDYAAPDDPTDTVQAYDWLAADKHHLVALAVRRHEVLVPNRDNGHGFTASFARYFCAHVVTLPDLNPVATLRFSGRLNPAIDLPPDFCLKVIAVDSPNARFLVVIASPDDDEPDHLFWWYWDRPGADDELRTAREITSDLYSEEAFLLPDGTRALTYLLPESNHAVIETVDPDTLHPTSRTEIPRTCLFYHHLAPLAPDAIALAYAGGAVAIYSISRRCITEELQVTNGVHAEAFLPRPWVRPSLLTEHPALRPGTTSPLAHRKWHQFLAGALQCRPGEEDEVAPLVGCALRVQTLPITPSQTPVTDQTMPTPAEVLYEGSLPRGVLASVIAHHLAISAAPHGPIQVLDIASGKQYPPLLAFGRNTDNAVRKFGRVVRPPPTRSPAEVRRAEQAEKVWRAFDGHVEPRLIVDGGDAAPLVLCHWEIPGAELGWRTGNRVPEDAVEDDGDNAWSDESGDEAGWVDEDDEDDSASQAAKSDGSESGEDDDDDDEFATSVVADSVDLLWVGDRHDTLVVHRGPYLYVLRAQ